MARRSNFARDFEYLHGQAWPPQGATRPQPRKVHVVDEDGVVLETRQDWGDPPPLRLGPITRTFAAFAVIYAMGLVCVGFIVVAFAAFVVASALLGSL